MNRTAKHVFLILFSCLYLSGRAGALENIGPFVALGYDNGGETLFTTEFEDGSKQKIKTHGGVSIAGGAIVPFSRGIELQASIAYKLDSSEAKNGEVSFQSFPLELILAKRIDTNHRIGAGLVHTFKNEFDCDISGICDFKEDFKDSNGLILQYDYTFNRKEHKIGWRIGVRYTRIDLESKIVDEKVDGDGLGVKMAILF